MKNKLEKSGSYGAVIAAAACPICFPKLAIISALFGFGALAQYEIFFFYGMQLLMILSLVGHVMSYRQHKNQPLLTLAITSVILFFISLYLYVSEVVSYIALAGLILATIWLYVENKRCANCDLSEKQT